MKIVIDRKLKRYAADKFQQDVNVRTISILSYLFCPFIVSYMLCIGYPGSGRCRRSSDERECRQREEEKQREVSIIDNGAWTV
jgi:hypothetical protein